jgi:hypothetical protein
MIDKNLFEAALIEPIRRGADELHVVSGYATATMAIRHIEAVRRQVGTDIAIRLIVGMCPQDGIQNSQHLGFKKLALGELGADFECGYITAYPPVHSKVYAWFSNGEPVQGFVGSANYTQNAFSGSMREILTEYDPSACEQYYQSLIGSTVNCLSEEVPDLINLFEGRRTRQQIIVEPEKEVAVVENVDLDKVTLTLLDRRTGEVPSRSGLNWGQRPEYGREPNQAYLNIPADVGRSNFFPERYVQFMVLTDDDKELICVRAQDNGKGLHTTSNNSLMGEYFRYRLGVPNGAPVTKDDLLNYGRTDVDFYKVDDETYYLDFSVGALDQTEF